MAGFCDWLSKTDAFLILTLAVCSGMLGGAVNAIVELCLYWFKVNELLHCTLIPVPYHPGWLYNKMVWGSFWGVLHALPFKRPHYLIRSVIYGLIASTVHCGIVFPAQGGGMYATHYGALTFIIVYLTDAAWATSSGLWFHFVYQRYEALAGKGKEKNFDESTGSSALLQDSAMQIDGTSAWA